MTPPVDSLIAPSTTSHAIHRTQHHRWRVESCPNEFSRECPERGREENSGGRGSLERGRDPQTETETKTKTWYIRYDVWMLDAGCWRGPPCMGVCGGLYLCVGDSPIRKPAPPPFAACNAPLQVSQMQRRWDDDDDDALEFGPTTSSHSHPTIQPTNRPTDQTTEATDHVSWCEARR